MSSVLIVPTHTTPPTLTTLIDRAGMPVIVVHTTNTTADIDGVTNLRDVGDVNIHRWWNTGILQAELLGADIAVIANHDVTPADDQQLPQLANTCRTSGATLGVVGDDDRMTGFCFALNLPHGLRPPEQFRWYWGDDWLWAESARSHHGRVVTGANVVHEKNPNVTYPRAFRPLVRQDKNTWARYLRDRDTPTLTADPTVSVVIPWRDTGCPHRARNMAEQLRWLEPLGWQVIPADDTTSADFNRSAARNRGVEQATGDILVVLDADVRVTHADLIATVRKAAATGRMHHPYHKVRYLTEAGTTALLAGREPRQRDTIKTSAGAPGGCAILPRAAWQPYDEQFTGWGHEDIEWATRTKATIGQAWGTGTAHHLYHPAAVKDERTQANHARLYAGGATTPTPPGTLDVVYRVRPGDDNEELRYSLRSLTNLPHRYVWIVGHKPAWVSDRVRHIPGNIHDGDLHHRKWANVFDNIRLACEHPDITDPFILIDDDMFVMERVDEVPLLHRGPLEDHIRVSGSGSWPESLTNTLNWCRANGIDNPVSYELHVPYPVHKAQMLEALAKARDWSWPVPPQARSVDGNLWARGGRLATDRKVTNRGRVTDVTSATFLSSDDRSFARIKHIISQTFPTMSRYEQEGPVVSAGNAALGALRAARRRGTATQRQRGRG